MATSGLSMEVEGLQELLLKLARMKNTKKQEQFLYRLIGTSSTPILKAYKRSLPKMYPATTTNQVGLVNKGDLIKSIEKIKSKGRHPAIYIGPRTKKMRKGTKGNLDGFFIQFLKYGKAGYFSGDPTLLSELETLNKPTAIRIGKGLMERIKMEWDK